MKSLRDTETEVWRIPWPQVFPYTAASLTHLEFRDKAGELLMPVVECWGRGDDQERSPDVFPLPSRHEIDQTCRCREGWWERKGWKQETTKQRSNMQTWLPMGLQSNAFISNTKSPTIPCPPPLAGPGGQEGQWRQLETIILMPKNWFVHLSLVWKKQIRLNCGTMFFNVGSQKIYICYRFF